MNAIPFLKGKLKKTIKGFRRNPLFFLSILLFVFAVFSLNIRFVRTETDNIGIFDSNFIFAESKEQNDDIFFQSPRNFVFETTEIMLIQQNSVMAVSSPLTAFVQSLGGVSEDDLEIEDSGKDREEIIEYVIKQGDTLSSIAAKFNISLNTLLWANDLNIKSTVKTGQRLIILPVSGVIHYVKDGDTISGIAQRYKTKSSEIISFNEISEEKIYIGDILIIPGGVMPVQTVPRTIVSPQKAIGSSYFMLPVSSPYIITQGLHWYNAIDFSHLGSACGKPVFAAAGGKIQKIGYDKWYGTYVRILHPNGVVTLYAHLGSILVSLNSEVSQGTIIGYIGNTGNTRGVTGCHLHFEVRGAANPFTR